MPARFNAGNHPMEGQGQRQRSSTARIRREFARNENRDGEVTRGEDNARNVGGITGRYSEKLIPQHGRISGRD